MDGKPNYHTGKVYYQTIERRDGEHLRVTIRFQVDTPDGKHHHERKTKVLSVDESATLSPVRKDGKANESLQKKRRANFESAWKSELADAYVQQAALQAVDALPSASVTVGEYVSQFIDDLEASGHIERSTTYSYRRFARIIGEAFPDTKLCDLNATMVQKWENGLVQAGYSPSTITKYHRLLSMTCRHAVEVDDLLKNPCSAVRTPKQKPHSPNSLTVEGFARLTMTLDMLEPSPVVTAAYLALYTGMRAGEVCGLRWREYDADNSVINVVEAIGNAGGTTFSKAPKTKSSIRTIPVHPKLADMLERRRELVTRELESIGVMLTQQQFGELYIIGRTDGSYMNPTTLTRAWKSLSESLPEMMGTQGRRLTLHDLRHTFATVAIAAGADVKAVAANLGHTNAAMTLNVYADADPQSKLRAVTMMGDTANRLKVKPFAQIAEGTE